MNPIELAAWLRKNGVTKHTEQMTLHGRLLLVVSPDGTTHRLELDQQAAKVAERSLAFRVG